MSNYFLFLIPTIILLQGCLYLGLSIWGLVMRECSQVTTDVFFKTFQFLTDLIYLQDQECGNPNVTVFGVEQPVELEVNWVNVEPIKNRTFIFLILYTGFSSLWIICSVWSISSLYGRHSKNHQYLIFSLWILVVISGSIVDAVATGFHIHDIIHTTSAANTFEYLGIVANEHAMQFLEGFSEHFPAPAIVMTCISSRIVIVWLLNIFGSVYCLSLLDKSAGNHFIATSANPATIDPPRQRVVLSL